MKKIRIKKAVISQKVSGDPKITLGQPGEAISVMFDFYDVTPNDILSLVNQPLIVDVELAGEKFGIPYQDD